MREYHGGVLANEQVLRVAQKDVRRRRKQRRAARKQGRRGAGAGGQRDCAVQRAGKSGKESLFGLLSVACAPSLAPTFRGDQRSIHPQSASQ